MVILWRYTFESQFLLAMYLRRKRKLIRHEHQMKLKNNTSRCSIISLWTDLPIQVMHLASFQYLISPYANIGYLNIEKWKKKINTKNMRKKWKPRWRARRTRWLIKIKWRTHHFRSVPFCRNRWVSPNWGGIAMFAICWI